MAEPSTATTITTTTMTTMTSTTITEELPSRSTADEAITTTPQCDKRKLSPDISPEQANVMKKLKETKTQPGESWCTFPVATNTRPDCMCITLLLNLSNFRHTVPVPTKVFRTCPPAIQR